MRFTLSLVVLWAFVLSACQPVVADSSDAPMAQPTLDDATEMRALMALPESLRAEAEIVSFDEDWNRVVLREGTSDIVCVAESPFMGGQYSVCQHVSAEEFWVYGMQLRMAGNSPDETDAGRIAALEDGTIQTPDVGAARYFLIGGREENLFALMGIHMPNATGATTGLPETPDSYRPWLMNAGTPATHIMMPGQ